ncbi:unnamed protein product, partial [Closterium sp. NIES-54]
ACDGDDSDDVDTSAFSSSGNGALHRVFGSAAVTADVSLADALDERSGGPEERFGVNGRRLKFKVGGSEEASSELLEAAGSTAKEVEKGVEAMGSAALKTRETERAVESEEETKRKMRISHGR